MNLYIKNLVVEKNGKISHCLCFGDGLSLVSNEPEIEEIIRAILFRESKADVKCDLRFFAQVKIEKTYCVRGTRKKQDETWQINIHSEDNEGDLMDEYRELVCVHGEVDSLSFFKGIGRQNYTHRLAQYIRLIRDKENFSFAKYTNGYAGTRSFRAFIAQYIGCFKPIRLREDREYFLRLTRNGVFKVCKGEEDFGCLSESEKMLSHYLSFLCLADFWCRAERVRNLNFVMKPLVICDFLQRVDMGAEFQAILRRTDRLSRQTIMFAPDEYGTNKYYVKNMISRNVNAA